MWSRFCSASRPVGDFEIDDPHPRIVAPFRIGRCKAVPEIAKPINRICAHRRRTTFALRVGGRNFIQSFDANRQNPQGDPGGRTRHYTRGIKPRRIDWFVGGVDESIFLPRPTFAHPKQVANDTEWIANWFAFSTKDNGQMRWSKHQIGSRQDHSPGLRLRARKDSPDHLRRERDRPVAVGSLACSLESRLHLLVTFTSCFRIRNLHLLACSGVRWLNE